MSDDASPLHYKVLGPNRESHHGGSGVWTPQTGHDATIWKGAERE